MKIVIENINRQMQDLLLFRGTQEDIVKKINTIGLRDDSILEPIEYPLSIDDIGFYINLGKFEDDFLDFEIYMLPTNAKDVFVITEVNEA